MPENETIEQPVVSPSRPSREPLFGALLFGTLVIVTIAALAGAGYAAYSGWKASKDRAARPSITELAVADKSVVPEQPVPASSAASEAPVAPSADAKSKDIAVLNGGAAKGTAAKVADILKKAGYTKVTAGNTVNDYSGVVVYYASGLEKEAEALKADLIASYPTATAKPAVSGNKETSVAPLTAIIGK